MKRVIGVFWAYLGARRRLIAAQALFILIFASVFALGGARTDAVLYAFLLCAFFGAIFAVFDFRRFYLTHISLLCMRDKIQVGLEGLSESGDLIYRDLRELLVILFEEKRRAVLSAETERTLSLDYCTLWAHQIKTPIAAMRLLLQSGTADKSALTLRLFEIEQYVNTVMQFFRLADSASDFVFREYSLSDIARQAIRKYAPVFIQKKLTLEFQESEDIVLTDEKWLVFVVEQLLSNALKYTPQGGKITVYSPSPRRLAVRDNGIGIAPEDMPRVFERGFTGYNGRLDKSSTGIGLFLCKRIVTRLSHGIGISSLPGEGTEVVLDLNREEFTA